MIERLLEKLIETAPEIAGIVVVVIVFVRVIRAERKSRDLFETTRFEEIKKMADRCHEHSKEMNERACTAIDNCTKTHNKVLQSLGAITETIKGCADRANGRRAQ